MKTSKATIVTGLGAAALAAVLVTAGAVAKDGRGGRGWHGDRGHHGSHSGHRSARGKVHRLRRADADGNGEVTLEEIEAMRAKRFAEIDANGDGTITQSELVERAKVRALARVMERIVHRTTRKMARLDKDRDGKVTPEEFSTMARERFAWSDLNSDGKISGDELPGRRWRGKRKPN